MSCFKFDRTNLELLITDFSMPEADGLSLARAMTKQFGDLGIIIVSGHLTSQQERDANSFLEGRGCLLKKPVSRRTLASAVSKVLKSRRARKLG